MLKSILGTLINPFSPLNLAIQSLAKLDFYADMLVMKSENQCYGVFPGLFKLLI